MKVIYIKLILIIIIGLLLFWWSIPTKAYFKEPEIIVSRIIEEPKETKLEDIKTHRLTTFISNKYNIDKDYVKDIVKNAHNLGDPKQFPTAIDILSIIAIESSFNRYAVSRARAKGLMQILYKETSFDTKTNILDGVALLKEYNKILSIEETIQAYNIGIGNYRSGMRNKKYLRKFKTIKQQLEKV